MYTDHRFWTMSQRKSTFRDITWNVVGKTERGIFHVVSGFPLHFMLYCGHLDCFSNSVFRPKRSSRKNPRTVWHFWFLFSLVQSMKFFLKYSKWHGKFATKTVPKKFPCYQSKCICFGQIFLRMRNFTTILRLKS